MKFQPDMLPGTNMVERVDAQGVRVGGVLHAGALAIPWRGAIQPWTAADWAAIGPEDFAGLASLAPEVIIFGTGPRLRFPPPAWTAALMARRVGVESMDTTAACRTFNVRVAEGRHAVAVLLPLQG